MPLWMKNLLENGVAMPMIMDEAGGGDGGSSASGGGSSESATPTSESGGGTSTSNDGAAADGGTAQGAADISKDGTGGKTTLFEGTAKAEGDAANPMTELLGEEYAENKSLEKFKSVQDLAKSYVELEKQVGKPKVGVPDENSTDEQRAEFYKSLGVPDDAAGYEFKRPEALPEGVPYDEAHASKWADIFKEHNIPAEAANALRDASIKEMLEQGVEGNAKATEALNADLDKYFGDKKSAKVAEVSSLMKEAISDDGLRTKISEALNGEQSVVVAATIDHVVQHMNKKFGRADSNIGNGGNAMAGQSPQSIRQEATKLMSSPAYQDAMHVDHKNVVARVNDMYANVAALTEAGRKR